MAFTEASHAGFTDKDKYELVEEINDKHFKVKFPLDKEMNSAETILVDMD